MATIVDNPDDFKREATVIEDTQEEFGEVEAPEESPQDDLPEKYRGKTPAEIARMHIEAEKRMGTQSQELGQLRQAFDEFVQSSITNQQKPAPEAPEEIDETEFFANPREAVSRTVQQALASDPTLQSAQRMAVEMAQNTALAKLQKAHPDMYDLARDEAFQTWVMASPVRRELHSRADQQYDFDAANELFTTYKETKGIVKQAQQMEKNAQKTQAKQASTGAARSTNDGRSSRKTYKRADIIELMKTNPKRYEAMLPELKAAYAEGRVKN